MMTSIKNILHPTDFSDCARVALPVACGLARDHGARLNLLYVKPIPMVVAGEFGAMVPESPGESDESIKARLREWAPADFKGTVCHVCEGDAAVEIVRVAEQTKSDMIVIGTHGRSGLRRVFLGSVAEAVLRTAPCPVLSVKPQQLSQDESADSEDAELATVCSVSNPGEAEIIRNALKGEGIRTFVEGGQQAGMVGLLGFPINIQVSPIDYDRATKFIRVHEEHHR